MPIPSATFSSGVLSLASNGASTASIERTVTTTSPNVRHALNIAVTRGPVKLSVVSVPSDADLIEEQTLRTGNHSLSFVPVESQFKIKLATQDNAIRIVSSMTIAPAGDLSVPSPWPEDVFYKLSRSQSGNVLYVADGVGPIRRVERRSNTSWSIVDVENTDGPWRSPNLNAALTLTPSQRGGVGTLTASKSFFKAGHVGAIFKIAHSGQAQAAIVTGGDQWSTPIKVTGVGASRALRWSVAGTFTGTLRLQQSIGNTLSFTNVGSTAAAGSFTYNDGLDNNVIYYRVGAAAGDFTSGTATASIEFDIGSTVGIARVTEYTSPTVVAMEVLSPFAKATASTDWSEGAWSTYRGWPKAITLFDGRLWAVRGDEIWGSQSDGFESFLPGDKASDAISRAIATGDVNQCRWLMSLSRLMVGTEGAEASVKSSNFDEPLTPTNNTIKDTSTYGTADIAPLRIDTQGLFVERSEYRVYQIVYDVQAQDYVSRNMMRLNKRIGKPGIKQLAVARQPDTRVYMIRADGQCVVMLYDLADNATGFCRLVTNGAFESVCVLPGIGEDQVFFVVRRQFGNEQRRYYEKLSSFDIETAADAIRLDSAVRRDGVESPVITGLDHLEGRTVAVWADGARHEDRVVTGAQITLDRIYEKVAVGESYDSLYRSSKLAIAAQAGTALTQMKRATHFAPILVNSTANLEYGGDFDEMDRIDDRAADVDWDDGIGLADFELEPIPIPGGHKRDKRVCLRASGPAPISVAGFVLGVQTNENT